MKITVKYKKAEIKYEDTENVSFVGYEKHAERVCGVIVVMTTQVKELIKTGV